MRLVCLKGAEITLRHAGEAGQAELAEAAPLPPQPEMISKASCVFSVHPPYLLLPPFDAAAR